MSTVEDRQAAIARLRELIRGIPIAMLTTVEPDGSLRSRPMAVQEVAFDGDLWFFSRDDTPKVDEIRADRHVNVSFARPNRQRFVSIAGNCEIVRDREKMKALWRPHLRAWFPQGLDDPHLVLLRVRAESAEYWDAPGGPVKHLLGAVRSMVTGVQPQPGDNRKLEL